MNLFIKLKSHKIAIKKKSSEYNWIIYLKYNFDVNCYKKHLFNFEFFNELKLFIFSIT